MSGFDRSRPVRRRARARRGARLHRADAHPGRGHPAGGRAAATSIGQAQTGSGKTAAFGLPGRSTTSTRTSPDIQVLVLVPTRELAIQVAQAMRTFARASGASNVVAVFGGQPIREQTEQLRRGPADRRRHARSRDGPDPPRLAAAAQTPATSCSTRPTRCSRSASSRTSSGSSSRPPPGRQTLLFSATMPPPIRRLAERYLIEPEHVKVVSPTLTVESDQPGRGRGRAAREARHPDRAAQGRAADGGDRLPPAQDRRRRAGARPARPRRRGRAAARRHDPGPARLA